MTDPTTTDDYAVRVLSISGAMCGTCGDEPGDQNCADCERVRRGYIADLRAAGWAPAASAVSLPPADQTAELVKLVTRSIFALKTPSPDGSKHYQSGWDDGLEAAMDAARDALAAVLPATTDQTAGWLDAAAECNRAGGAYAERGANDAAGASFALMETFLRKAGQAEYVATPCSGPVPCEDGGEPCDVHERLMGHAEGDHELCAPDCGEPWMRRMADETPAAETEAHEPLHQWRVEILDGDEWMPASGLRRDRAQAVDQLQMSSAKRPLWNDGTKVQRRLVRETTTYTVEQPAAGARQDGAQR